MKFLQYIFLIKILLISTQNIQNNTLYKCNSSNSEGLKIGDKVILCIHFQTLNIKIPFIIEVDKYSTVSIEGGFSLAYRTLKNHVGKFNNLNLIAQVGNFTTEFPAFFFNQEEFVPLFNLVIKVKEGKIFEIVWDESCNGCKKEKCKPFESFSIFNHTHKSIIKNCFFLNNICSDNPSSFKCDPKFYITWFGTDKKKRQLKSSALAMSKFKRYSTSSLYNSIIDIFNNTKGNMEQQWNDISNSIHEILNLLNNF